MAEEVVLWTPAGGMPARWHPAAAGDAAVLWVFGAGGGFDGPAASTHGSPPASPRPGWRHSSWLTGTQVT
jgi:hypothetical protein